jgi:hypothetical protein
MRIELRQWLRLGRRRLRLGRRMWRLRSGDMLDGLLRVFGRVLRELRVALLLRESSLWLPGVG